MSRNIILSGKPLSRNNSLPPDDFTTRLVKLIPADIIAVYLAVMSLIHDKMKEEPNLILLWVVFGITLAITPFYLAKVAKITETKQIILCTLSFIIWALNVYGPFHVLLANQPLFTSEFIGAITLPLFTLLIPFFY